MTIPDQVQDEVLHVTLLGEFRLVWGETAVENSLKWAKKRQR